MTNYKQKRETANDIYLHGYQQPNFFNVSIFARDSRMFFLDLRAAVIYELLTMGYCELLDDIIEGRYKEIDIVAFATFMDIMKGAESNAFADIEKDLRYKDFVPFVSSAATGRKVQWSQCKFGTTTIPVKDNLEAIRRVREIVRKHQKHNAASKQQATDTPNVKEDKERKTIVENANVQAKKIVTNAETKADNINEEAHKNAERIIEEAHKNAERIIEEAKTKAKEIEDSANKQISKTAEEKTEKLIERYLTEEQRAYKTELNNDIREFTDSFIESTHRTMSVYSEMYDAANAIQANWIGALDDTISKMTEVRSELYSHLRDWKVSLSPKDIKPLAERFLELYRILNVDKLLREEMLLESFSDKKNDNGKETEKKTIDDSANRITGLQKMNNTLMTFLRRFELSLAGLDLYVYYPNAGEMFDEMWHVPDDENEDHKGKKIEECIVPGIAKKANDDYGDDVLIPAVVRVETEK